MMEIRFLNPDDTGARMALAEMFVANGRIPEAFEQYRAVLKSDPQNTAAREALGNEPFLLMLGDHLYRSNIERSCAQQLLEAYHQHGTSLVGLRRTPEDQIAAFGTVAGVWLEGGELLNIIEFAEKPTVDYARSHLLVPGLPGHEYLTLFGQYIIKPQIFDYLEEHIKNNVRERGEFQLTSALDRLRQDVLEGLGWHIHRIWSRDWIEDPQKEVDKVLRALEQVQRTPRTREPSSTDPDPKKSMELKRRETEVNIIRIEECGILTLASYWRNARK